ncbi:hypothetical protein ACU8KH_00347 [Lachancea thermotolerans]
MPTDVSICCQSRQELNVSYVGYEIITVTYSDKDSQISLRPTVKYLSVANWLTECMLCQLGPIKGCELAKLCTLYLA